MSQERSPVPYDDEITLRDYLLVIVNKWWVVVSVFVITVVGAVVYLVLTTGTDNYEARTKLLLASDFPAGAFFNLAQADDLLKSVVEDLDLRDDEGPWPPSRLSDMMEIAIEPLEQAEPSDPNRDRSIPTHILTMTVRSSDSSQVKPIADTWSRAFLGEGRRFFSEAYSYALARYNATLEDLQATESERLEYLRESQLVSLKSRLSALTTQEVSTTPVSTFEVDTVPLGQSVFQVLVDAGDQNLPGNRGTYQEFLFRLDARRSELAAAEGALANVEEALASEPRFIEVEETSDGTESVSQQPNEVYTSLATERGALLADIGELKGDIAYLESATVEMQSEVDDLSRQIATIELELARFDRELGFMETNARRLARDLHEEAAPENVQEQFIQVLESPVEPQRPIAPQGRRQTLLIASVLGIALGVLVALAVHYLREPAAE